MRACRSKDLGLVDGPCRCEVFVVEVPEDLPVLTCDNQYVSYVFRLILYQADRVSDDGKNGGTDCIHYTNIADL